jgi:hypothetical protein
MAGKRATGRTGMDLWQILVLGVVRLAGLYKLGAAKRKNGPVECGWNGLSVCMS